MMKKSNDNLTNIMPSIRYLGKFIYIYAIIIIIIVFMFFNTISLDNALKTSTNDYVTDVSAQLADDISGRINSVKTSLSLLADSIGDINDHNQINELLLNEADKLNFTNLFVVDQNGDTFPKQTNLIELANIDSSFQGHDNLIYVEGKSLLFSTPIITKDGHKEALVGIRDQKNIQNLIKPTSFSGKGSSCIIDKNGNIIIFPSESSAHIKSSNIFTDIVDKTATDNVNKMKKDITKGKSGAFKFDYDNNNSLVIAYNSLNTNDWSLITLVPAELISDQTSHFVFYNFILVAAIIVFFSISLYHILSFYNKQRKQLNEIAFVDPLTNGPNNNAFKLRCENIIRNAKPFSYIIIFLDIKQFKLVNQTYGYDNGDAVLKYIYKILNNNIKSNELVARSESDHFFLCLNESKKEIIQRRLNSMISEINLSTQDLVSHLTILQGACFIEEPNCDINTIQDYARLASKINLKKADCTYYDKEILGIIKKEQELNDLRSF